MGYMTGGDQDSGGGPQRPSWADDSYYHDTATGVWQKKANQATVTAPPPVANARAEFDASGNATGNYFGPGGQTFTAEKYITPEQQQWRQSQGVAPLTVGDNGYAVSKQEGGIDHISKSGKFMKVAVPLVLAGMAGYGALGAAGVLGQGAASLGAAGGAASGAAPAGFSYGMTLPGLGAGGAGWGGTAAAGAGGLGSLFGGGGGTLSNIMQGAKYISPAMKLIGGLTGGGGQPGRAGPGGQGTQGGVAGQGGNIQDLLAAYYAAQQNKDYAGNMKRLYSEMEGRQKPFLDQLNASYQDPNSFYGSNQWKGLESVYQNSIDRKAASQGRLANPTDREVLLQNYGMKELENYRSGLRQNAATFDPARLAPMAQAGYQAERNANSPMFGAVGNIGAQPGGWQSWFQKLIGGGAGVSGGGGEWGSPGSELPSWAYPDPEGWGSPGSELPGYMYPEDPGGFEGNFPMPDGGSDFDPNWFEGY